MPDRAQHSAPPMCADTSCPNWEIPHAAHGDSAPSDGSEAVNLDPPEAPKWYQHAEALAWESGWDAAIRHLLSLPVEQRMKAMGMVQFDASCEQDGVGGHWHENPENVDG